MRKPVGGHDSGNITRQEERPWKRASLDPRDREVRVMVAGCPGKVGLKQDKVWSSLGVEKRGALREMSTVQRWGGSREKACLEACGCWFEA